ncbi:hypothetical protein DKM44_14790 [Deinococcus irradiatisoli]|uniref:DUF1795 domain-containing protein n=1 Tax=Deinococcus irradiatisoli TaxID=2202254 RepID=A0A2Z3JGP9_9DEIO|nr:DcrB-related protein [Deinococcus irradiatisoli]AWN24337.1 hypothetical protein DKM44_14790 [Deinococcus irradiatisoli]
MKPLFVALLALLGSAQAATFKSKAYPYTLMVPDDWQSKKVPGVDVALAAPSSAGSVPASLNVAVTQVDPALKVTLSDLRALTLKQASEALKNPQLLGEADVKVGGQPGHVLNYLGSEEGVPMHWIQVFTLKGNLAYVLTFATPQASFEQDKKLANQILNSFKIN